MESGVTMMKIKQVHIDGFGKWLDQDFEFTGNPQVIFGNNEAGKTTLAIFIRSILFGFANAKGKNRYQQYKPRSSEAYGGSLVVEDKGKEYRIQRTKGKAGGKVTVTDEKGHQFGQKKLDELLANVDQELYQAIFGFSQADLSAIDNVNQENVQQHLQQIGAVGSSEWNQFTSQLLKQGDAIFKPRGRKPLLNQHLKEYQTMQARLQSARGNYDKYAELTAAKEKNNERAAALQSKLEQLQPQLERLEQLARLWPVYAQWKQGQQSRGQKQISDEEVDQVNRFRVQEQELQRQEQATQEQLTKLNGQASQFDEQSLADYHDHLADYQQLQSSLLQLQAQADHQQQQEQVLEQRFQERNQIQERYGHQLPKPLSERETVQLEQLIRDHDQLPASNQKLAFGLIALGALFFILGLVSRHGTITFLGVLLLAGAGFWLYRLHNLAQAESQRRQKAVDKFGHEHGLSNFPSNQWLTMQPDLHRVAELNQELENSQDGVAKRQRQFNDIKHRLAGRVNGENVAELSHNLTSWLNQMASKWQELQEIKQQSARVHEQLTELRARLRKTQNEKWAIYQSVGVGNDESFNEFLRQRSESRNQEATTTAFEKQLTDQDKQELAKFADEDSLQDRLQTTRDAVSEDRVSLQHVQEQAQQEQIAVESLVADGTLAELEQQEANLAAKIWQEAKEWVGYQLAVQWINRALILASADRYPAIITAAEKYFAVLTNDHYQQIMLNDEGVQVLTDSQERFAVGELSTGTAEQLYVALRLGFISVMSDRISLPVIIDDSFVNFDNVRRGRVLDLLKQLASDNQVLYFTADDRALEFDHVLNLNKVDRE